MSIQEWSIIVGTVVVMALVACFFVRTERSVNESIRSEPVGPSSCADCRHRMPEVHIAWGYVCDHPSRVREWRDAVSGELKSNGWERECRRFNDRGQCKLFEPRPEGVPWPTRTPRPTPPPPPAPDRRISRTERQDWFAGKRRTKP